MEALLYSWLPVGAIQYGSPALQLVKCWCPTVWKPYFTVGYVLVPYSMEALLYSRLRVGAIQDGIPTLELVTCWCHTVWQPCFTVGYVLVPYSMEALLYSRLPVVAFCRVGPQCRSQSRPMT
jgi:hypothetical protein